MFLNRHLPFRIRILKYFSYQSGYSQLKTIEFPFFSFQFSAQVLQVVSLLLIEVSFFRLLSNDTKIQYPF